MAEENKTEEADLLNGYMTRIEREAENRSTRPQTSGRISLIDGEIQTGTISANSGSFTISNVGSFRNRGMPINQSFSVQDRSGTVLEALVESNGIRILNTQGITVMQITSNGITFGERSPGALYINSGGTMSIINSSGDAIPLYETLGLLDDSDNIVRRIDSQENMINNLAAQVQRLESEISHLTDRVNDMKSRE